MTSKSLPFLAALRQMRTDVGRENSVYVHVTWLPFIAATDEFKRNPLSIQSASCAR